MMASPFSLIMSRQIVLCFAHRFLYKAGVCENKNAPCGRLGTKWIPPGETELFHGEAPRLSCRVNCRPHRRPMEDCALRVPFPRVQRFSHLQRAVPGITQKVLAHQLREMEKSGLLIRTVYPEVPPKVEYQITSLS